MNKKTCCGFFGAGCLLLIVAVIFGGYYGVNFLYDSGKKLAASGLKQSIDHLAEMAFAPEDRKEITDLGDEAANMIRDGELSLTDLLEEVNHQLETNNLHVKALLLGFARKTNQTGDKQPAEDGPVENAHPEANEVVQRVIFGILEDKISTDQLASITVQIAALSTEKIPVEGSEDDPDNSSRRLKSSLTEEDIAAGVAFLNEICDDSGVESPGEEFDATEVVKDEIKAIFARFKKIKPE